MSRQILTKIDTKSILSLGLDVSKQKIDVCILTSGVNATLKIENTQKGISHFVTTLKDIKMSREIPIIIESTGDYNTLACLLFSEAKFSIKEINPIITKQYITHTIRGTKTDKTDALALAKIGLQDGGEFHTYDRTRKFIGSAKKIALISSLEKQIQSLKATIKGFREVNEQLHIKMSVNINAIKKSVEGLEKNIKKLQAEVQTEDLGEKHSKSVELLTSIIGVSEYMAKVFYITFAHKDFLSKESMFAFTGFDPKLRNSGEMNGKASISKRGNDYVRKKLFQAGFCSVQHCDLFKQIYERMKAKGKHHFTCVIAVVKKIVHIMYAMLKNNTVFQPQIT